MLGTLSLGKILLLVIVIAVVVQLMRNSARSKAAAAGKPRAVELTPCPRCGVYLPKGRFCPGGPACGKR